MPRNSPNYQEQRTKSKLQIAITWKLRKLDACQNITPQEATKSSSTGEQVINIAVLTPAPRASTAQLIAPSAVVFKSFPNSSIKRGIPLPIPPIIQPPIPEK